VHKQQKEIAGSPESSAPRDFSTRAQIEGARGVKRPVYPTQNYLLAALHATDYERLLPCLEHLWMPSGLVLQTNDQPDYIYFPTSSIISLMCVMENGDSSAVASIGNEGLVGLAILMGGQCTSTTAVVHSAGSGYRIRAAILKREFEQHGNFQQLVIRYARSHMAQMAQTSACNRHHSVDQQLCCWLLLSLDRLQGNEVVITQGLIANFLGVHRERVTAAANHFRMEKIIQCGRGRIHVLDRARLEKRACECYGAIKKEFAFLSSSLRGVSQQGAARHRR
jgi:CRP-like cAMP-binding protein